MKPDFTKIKALLKEGTPSEPKYPWTIARGNDQDDFPIIRGIPHQWIYSLVNGKTVAYAKDEVDAALIVELRNQIDGIMEYCEGLEKKLHEIYTEQGIGNLDKEHSINADGACNKGCC